jgi:hypothetical protein
VRRQRNLIADGKWEPVHWRAGQLETLAERPDIRKPKVFVNAIF